MKTILHFLLIVFVRQFYLINAGFFLFLFFVFFGVVNGSQLISYHQSLMFGMIGSPIFMGAVLCCWLLYNFKCIAFCNAVISSPESSYIFSLKALSPAKQLLLYLAVSSLLYLPVMLYAGFVIYLSFIRSMLFTGLLVLAFQLLMITVSAFSFFLSINRNNQNNSIEKLTGFLAGLYSIPLKYPAFLIGYIFDNKKMAFTGVKIFSILLLSVSFIRNDDHFDADFFSIFFQLILTGHAVLVFYCVQFNESLLQFSRNMPIALYKIAGMYLITFSFLLLPELLFMLINNNGNLPMLHIVELYLTAIATLFFYTATLYACGLNMERMLLFVFISFLVIFFLQKTGQQLLLMLGLLAAGAAVFWTHYFDFEQE
jgi:hypothetical protein